MECGEQSVDIEAVCFEDRDDVLAHVVEVNHQIGFILVLGELLDDRALPHMSGAFQQYGVLTRSVPIPVQQFRISCV